ncbi:hypothetical protein ACQQ2N_12645 [Dokdonella sp. MW10]|uniref:hypothetical protein n=1 Tax=Dokdonella sp. MW10 TaxID=2992926 RepID=UPI003F815732
MSLTQPQRFVVFAILVLLMAATRINHFAVVPDASWAVFFVAGFYLRHAVRWAFPALLALAVVIDYAVITSQGLSFWAHYCMSPAYGFLLASYAILWFGGAWLNAHHGGLRPQALGLLAVSVLAATSLTFLVTNGSFYWLSASVASPSMGGWMTNLGHWYLPYLTTTASYVGVAALLHVIVGLFVQQAGPVGTKRAGRG